MRLQHAPWAEHSVMHAVPQGGATRSSRRTARTGILATRRRPRSSIPWSGKVFHQLVYELRGVSRHAAPLRSRPDSHARLDRPSPSISDRLKNLVLEAGILHGPTAQKSRREAANEAASAERGQSVEGLVSTRPDKSQYDPSASVRKVGKQGHPGSETEHRNSFHGRRTTGLDTRI